MVIVEQSDADAIVQLKHVHTAERELGALLARLAAVRLPAASDCRVFAFTGKACTRATEAMQGWALSPMALHEEQERAVDTLLARGASVLQGAAGSGKTVVIAELVRRLGASSAVARTLHSVLASTTAPRELFPSGRATVVVDESSMLNALVLHRFLTHLQRHGIVIERLLLVGDRHQPPPLRSPVPVRRFLPRTGALSRMRTARPRTVACDDPTRSIRWDMHIWSSNAQRRTCSSRHTRQVPPGPRRSEALHEARHIDRG